MTSSSALRDAPRRGPASDRQGDALHRETLTPTRWALALAVALLIALLERNTIYNNAYAYGATVHDSTFFEGMIWHAGWALRLPQVMGGGSYFQTHVSPLMLVPNALSYLYPGDRLSFYALVYGAGYGLMSLVVFWLLAKGGRGFASAILAALGGLAFFCSQSVFMGAWEPHMEVVAPAFAMLSIRAWQQRSYGVALSWHVTVSMLREDFALLFCAPIVLLAGAQYLRERVPAPDLARERLLWAAKFLGLSLAYTGLAILLQKIFYPGVSVLDNVYFSADAPFGHLSAALLQERATEIAQHRIGMWLPLALLVAGTLWLRDLRLLAGALCFIPFLAIGFISKEGTSGSLTSYKAFPLGLALLWPALMAPRAGPDRFRYLLLQALAMGASLIFFIEPGTVRVANERWVPRPLSRNADVYRAFLPQLKALQRQGSVRASHGVRALYPYDFAPWYLSDIENLKPEQLPGVQTLLWFQGDRNQMEIDALLKRGRYRVTAVPNTRIRIAQRLPAP
ncbi:MAG: hypothetical protein ABIW85_11350 [Variovorax sp.]